MQKNRFFNQDYVFCNVIESGFNHSIRIIFAMLVVKEIVIGDPGIPSYIGSSINCCCPVTGEALGKGDD
jgi:hypothetical protein